MIKALDLNDIRTFAAIAEAGTLSAAGKTLHVPTSTVSRSLTRLEKHIGVLLIQRNHRGLALTDSGREYLRASRRALAALKDGAEQIEFGRSNPKGIIKVRCPVTMARDVLAPLLKEFLSRFPELRVEVEPYTSGWDQEPAEDVDVYFKLRAPNDSARRIRVYPGTARALFASTEYVDTFGKPSKPEDLRKHSCVGSGVWKLTRGEKTASPDIVFRVQTLDPQVHLTLALQAVGICILPIWMARWPEARSKLVPILPLWRPDPITLCALFTGHSRLTPKVQVFLDYLTEYIGTERDPRLRQKWTKDLFTPISTQLRVGP